MNEHLPECPTHQALAYSEMVCAEWGICDRLRAAEQRERARLLTDNSGFGWAYSEGVKAARDAVTALLQKKASSTGAPASLIYI